MQKGSIFSDCSKEDRALKSESTGREAKKISRLMLCIATFCPMCTHPLLSATWSIDFWWTNFFFFFAVRVARHSSPLRNWRLQLPELFFFFVYMRFGKQLIVERNWICWNIFIAFQLMYQEQQIENTMDINVEIFTVFSTFYFSFILPVFSIIVVVVFFS